LLGLLVEDEGLDDELRALMALASDYQVTSRRRVDHPGLGMVRSLGRLLGVAPHLHDDGYRPSANRGRLERDAPFYKTVLMTSGLKRRVTSPVDGDGTNPPVTKTKMPPRR
jgi:hypothetical protein